MVTPLDAALEYASRGYPVFPCSPNSKVPFARTNGCKDATTDEATIRRWWESAPTANVAIATGSVSGLYVVDVDVPSSEVMPLLPTTWTARTRGGGWHYIYATSEPLPNTNKKAPNAVHGDADTRGEGGYILVFPSVIDGAPYTWVNDIDPAPLPAWIADRVRPKPETRMATRQMFAMVSTSWAGKALDEECAKVASTGEGGRNEALNRASFKIGQIVAGGHLSAHTAAQALDSAAAQSGLPERERQATITRSLKAGMASPRHPERREHIDPFGGQEITLDFGEPEVLPAIPPKPPKPDADAQRWALLNRVRELGGLCDSFCAWVIRGADHPQPGLTLGAMLALGSVVAGRRLVYRRSLSSLYVVSMANSAEGKNRPQSCMSRVIDEVWPCLAGPNSFSSGPAFVDGVRKAVNQGTGTALVLDEYGMQLANMMGPRAAGHRQDIKHSLTELATKGVDKWSPALSLIKGGGKLELWAPSVTILGSTTPESLHSVLTSTDVADGFVGRHVWMRSQDVLPMWQPPEMRGDDAIPIDVRSAMLALRTRHDDWHMALPVQESGIDEIRLYAPMTMGETPEAGKRLLDHKMACDEDRRRGQRLEIPRAVLGRAPEFAARMAMILAVLSQPEDDCPEVALDHVEAAIALADESASVFAASLAANQRPDWNDPEAQANYVLSAIRAGDGQLGRAELLRACRRLTARTIGEVLARLAEEGEVVISKEASTGGREKEVILLNK